MFSGTHRLKECPDSIYQGDGNKKPNKRRKISHNDNPQQKKRNKSTKKKKKKKNKTIEPEPAEEEEEGEEDSFGGLPYYYHLAIHCEPNLDQNTPYKTNKFTNIHQLLHPSKHHKTR